MGLDPVLRSLHLARPVWPRPWKNEDIAFSGTCGAWPLGQASWLHPNVGGVLPTSGGVLPYWLGSASIMLFNGWLDPAFGCGIPFALLLTAVLALTRYTTFHLCANRCSQPLPLAFEAAAPADYARAVADGALLALIASLGLLQLGHETTPELLQLTGSALVPFTAWLRRNPALARPRRHPCQPTYHGGRQWQPFRGIVAGAHWVGHLRAFASPRNEAALAVGARRLGHGADPGHCADTT